MESNLHSIYENSLSKKDRKEYLQVKEYTNIILNQNEIKLENIVRPFDVYKIADVLPDKTNYTNLISENIIKAYHLLGKDVNEEIVKSTIDAKYKLYDTLNENTKRYNDRFELIDNALRLGILSLHNAKLQKNKIVQDKNKKFNLNISVSLTAMGILSVITKTENEFMTLMNYAIYHGARPNFNTVGFSNNELYNLEGVVGSYELLTELNPITSKYNTR